MRCKSSVSMALSDGGGRRVGFYPLIKICEYLDQWLWYFAYPSDWLMVQR